MQYFARAELIDKMKEIALLSGEFTLRSGKTSNWYFAFCLGAGTIIPAPLNEAETVPCAAS